MERATSRERFSQEQTRAYSSVQLFSGKGENIKISSGGTIRVVIPSTCPWQSLYHPSNGLPLPFPAFSDKTPGVVANPLVSAQRLHLPVYTGVELVYVRMKIDRTRM